MRINLDALKSDLLKLSTIGKSVGILVIGGAASSALSLLQGTDPASMLFASDGLVKLKHRFITGALIAFLGWLVPSPLKAALAASGPTPGK